MVSAMSWICQVEPKRLYFGATESTWSSLPPKVARGADRKYNTAICQSASRGYYTCLYHHLKRAAAIIHPVCSGPTSVFHNGLRPRSLLPPLCRTRTCECIHEPMNGPSRFNFTGSDITNHVFHAKCHKSSKDIIKGHFGHLDSSRTIYSHVNVFVDHPSVHPSLEVPSSRTGRNHVVYHTIMNRITYFDRQPFPQLAELYNITWVVFLVIQHQLSEAGTQFRMYLELSKRGASDRAFLFGESR
jgi:hypothetical protein